MSEFKEFDPTDEDLAGVNPVAVLLVACLAGQVSDLARLHRMGAWKDDPSEIGEWLREEFGESGQGTKGGQLKKLATWEWMLWEGRKTEVLCESLESEVGVIVDPQRIVKLAQKRSVESAGSGQGNHFFGVTGSSKGGHRLVV